MKNIDDRSKFYLMLFFFSLLRFLFSISINLGMDETYSTVIARVFSLSYYDHPPIHYWILNIVSKISNSNSPGILRFPFLLMFAITSSYMYKGTEILFSSKVALKAVLILNIIPLFSISGFFIVPDGPLMLAMSITYYLWIRILFLNENKLYLWLLSGFFLGLACLSKYHGVLLGLGFVMYIFFFRKNILATFNPYISLIVFIITLSPLLIWNYNNNFVSFLFQGKRGMQNMLNPLNLVINILGQSIFLLPWYYIGFIRSIIDQLMQKNDKIYFLLCLGLPPILLFTILRLFSSESGHFHWQLSGYFFIIPVYSYFIINKKKNMFEFMKIILNSIIYILFILVIVQCKYGLIDLKKISFMNNNDPSIEVLQWDELIHYEKYIKNFEDKIGFYCSNHRLDAPKIAYSIGSDIPVLCLSNDPRHFQFMYDIKTFEGKNGLIILFRGKNNVQQDFGKYFNAIEYLGEVPIYRNGVKQFDLSVYIGKGFVNGKD